MEIQMLVVEMEDIKSTQQAMNTSLSEIHEVLQRLAEK